jgi:hypothetical protein
VASQRRADRTAGHSRRADYLPGDDFRGDAFFVDFVAGFFAVGATFFEVAFLFIADFFLGLARAAFFAGALVDDFERLTVVDREAFSAGLVAGRLTVGEASVGAVGNPIAAWNRATMSRNNELWAIIAENKSSFLALSFLDAFFLLTVFLQWKSFDGSGSAMLGTFSIVATVRATAFRLLKSGRRRRAGEYGRRQSW